MFQNFNPYPVVLYAEIKTSGDIYDHNSEEYKICSSLVCLMSNV